MPNHDSIQINSYVQTLLLDHVLPLNEIYF